jgi:TIR domain-containing protein
LSGSDVSEQYVFIAHKSQDKRRIRPVVEQLLKRGLFVWIDNPEDFVPPLAHKNLRRLRGGQNFRNRIPEYVNEAGCVLVIWSELSVKSTNVCGEAKRALAQDKLVPIRIDRVELPYGFDDLKTADLTEKLDAHLLDPLQELELEAVIEDIEQTIATKVESGIGSRGPAVPQAPPVRIEFDPSHALRRARVDPKITFLLDRDRQVADFASYICRAMRADDGARRPAIVLLAAPREERSDTFLESICHRARGSVRDVLGNDFDLVRKPFAWPQCGSLLRREQAARQLTTCIGKVGAALNVAEGVLEYDPEDFVRRLTGRLREFGQPVGRVAAVLTTQIHPDCWTSEDEQLLRNFMSWWQELLLDAAMALPVLVISVVRPAAARRIGWFWRRADIAAFLDRLEPGAFPRLNLLKLGLLDRISAQHAYNWVEHVLPRHLDIAELDLEPIRRAIENRFAVAAMQPLDEVARWLQGLLDEMPARTSPWEGTAT